MLFSAHFFLPGPRFMGMVAQSEQVLLPSILTADALTDMPGEAHFLHLF